MVFRDQKGRWKSQKWAERYERDREKREKSQKRVVRDQRGSRADTEEDWEERG